MRSGQVGRGLAALTLERDARWFLGMGRMLSVGWKDYAAGAFDGIDRRKRSTLLRLSPEIDCTWDCDTSDG